MTDTTLTIGNNGASLPARSKSNALTFYERFQNPLEAVDKFGAWLHESGMLAKNPGQGRLIAMACMMEGKNPLVVIRENMIVDGKLTRKYQMLLVDLRAAGGDYEWVDDGENGQKATIRIHWNGKSHEYTYTFEMAKRAGVVKKDGAWETRPGNMLRSKAVRQAFDMYCPEISAGYLTPEDAEEISVEKKTSPVVGVATTATAALDSATTEKTEEIEAEVDSEPQPNDKVSHDQLATLVNLGKQLGLTGPQIQSEICTAADIEDPFDLSIEQFGVMKEKLDSKLRAMASAGN